MTQPRFATRDTESGMAGLGAPPSQGGAHRGGTGAGTLRGAKLGRRPGKAGVRIGTRGEAGPRRARGGAAAGLPGGNGVSSARPPRRDSSPWHSHRPAAPQSEADPSAAARPPAGLPARPRPARPRPAPGARSRGCAALRRAEEEGGSARAAPPSPPAAAPPTQIRLRLGA